MSEDTINPNEEAAPDPRIDTQRQNRALDSLHDTDRMERQNHPPDALSDTDKTQPINVGRVLSQEESGALDRRPNRGSEENPTGDAHFYEMAPTSTSGATAMQEIDEDFENDED